MLKLEHISKRYQYQKVLDDVSMELPESGLIGIIGPSGCGKSTLLHIMGGIDREFQGNMFFKGRSVKHHLRSYRRRHVSFIFQHFYLIMWLSMKTNKELSQYFSPQQLADHHLSIDDLSHLKMSALSHGQRQRLAYLRGVYHDSDILLCDEPTGSLDPQMANEVMELLKTEATKRLVILVSHDEKLVHQYCDEIYQMYDGCIVRHQVLHTCLRTQDKCKNKVKKFLGCFRLSWMSFFSHKWRSIQLVMGLTLSLLCILLTLTMSRGLEEQIYQYIYSIVPPSGISFQMKQHESVQQTFCNELESLPGIEKVQLYLDDYEFLGIGFVEEQYQQSQVVFIGDDTAPFSHLSLKLGRYPEADQEIMVSLSTAQHLCGEQDISELIGKKVFAWYQYGYEVKAIAYHVVGISQQSTVLDTLYQRSNAYIHLLKDVFMFDETQVQSQLGIIYVDANYQRSEIMKQLEKDYPEYQFMEIGASTSQKVSDTMQQVQMILIVFSSLAILSSLFLIGEVMFLNVVQKKKDFAIMKCFGATFFDLLKIVFGESMLIILFAQIMAMINYIGLLIVVNQYAQKILLIDQMIFSFDYQLLLIVYGLSYELVFLSQLPPFLYVLRFNTIQALKN